MTAEHSVNEVREDLVNILTREDQDLALDDTSLDDFAKIGSLMTDKAACISHLARINSELLARVESLGMRRRGRKLGLKKMDLKKADYQYSSPRAEGQNKQESFRETKGLLAGFLRTWEQSEGFNKGVAQQEGGLPPRPPELTEWLRGDDFRRYLLKHGYHWTDTAVGGRHGEFTHRLHWYIVCGESKARPNWLTNEPVDLFKRCGDVAAVNPRAGRDKPWSVWDQLFDNGATGPAGQPNYWRCPETLHAFLCEEATMKRKDLWVLAQMIDSRALMAKSIGKNEITADYQAFEAAHIDEVLLRGDKTGMGGATPGTIMWRDLNESPAFWQRV